MTARSSTCPIASAPARGRLLPLLALGLVLVQACSPPAGTCRDGVLDYAPLAGSGQPVALAGEWEFWWDTFLDPAAPVPAADSTRRLVPVPGYWTSPYQASRELPAQGHGTFRLVIRHADPGTVYGLWLSEVATAYTIWINGQCLGGAGQPGTTARDSRGNLANRLFIPQAAGDGEYRIIIHVSNFDYSRGGIGISPVFGAAQQLVRQISQTESLNWAIMGIMLVVALIFIGFGLLRHREPTTMYFGLFSLSLILRMLLQTTRIGHELLPGLGLNWLFATEILSSVLLTSFFLGYFKSSFGIGSTLPVRLIQTGNLAYGLVCCTGIIALIEPLILYYDILIILAGGYVLGKLVQAVRRRQPRALTVLVSFSFLLTRQS